ncbi:MAG: hypothetical protein IPF54_23445 [Draconibacterium sp.]|nr:hypothetical protein [Draconibacterium sp.]
MDGKGNIKEFTTLIVGAGIDGTEPFEGAIDEVKLYDSAIEEASFTRSFKLQEQVMLKADIAG